LKNYKELGVINYMYGIGKAKGQLLRSFVTNYYDLYFKTDSNLEKQTNGLVVPISEAEYEEKYIKELGNQEK